MFSCGSDTYPPSLLGQCPKLGWVFLKASLKHFILVSINDKVTAKAIKILHARPYCSILSKNY